MANKKDSVLFDFQESKRLFGKMFIPFVDRSTQFYDMYVKLAHINKKNIELIFNLSVPFLFGLIASYEITTQQTMATYTSDLSKKIYI